MEREGGVKQNVWGLEPVIHVLLRRMGLFILVVLEVCIIIAIYIYIYINLYM